MELLRRLISISLALTGPAVFAHGGDSHDVTPAHLLRGKVLEDQRDEHDRSRFSVGLTVSASQRLGRSDNSDPNAIHTNSKLTENRLNSALNYRLTQATSFNLLGSLSSVEGVQDPAFGSTYIRPITSSNVQSITFGSISAPVSKISREQKRVFTLNLSTGLLGATGRWTAGAYGKFGLPVYGGSRSREVAPNSSEHQEEGETDATDTHENVHTAERFLVGGTIQLACRLGNQFRLDAVFDSIAKRLVTDATVFDSELTIVKLCYLGTDWEAGIGIAWKEQNAPYLRFPIHNVSNLTLTVWP